MPPLSRWTAPVHAWSYKAALRRPPPRLIALLLQPCGYYALMDFARREGSDSVLGFIESAARYRLAAGRDDTRTQR